MVDSRQDLFILLEGINRKGFRSFDVVFEDPANVSSNTTNEVLTDDFIS
jgi:hypothetical protein